MSDRSLRQKGSMNRILINGDRTYLPIDGMNRWLSEMVRSLDLLEKKDKYVLVVPSDVDGEFHDRIRELKSIEIRKTLLPHFRFWTFLYIDLPGLILRRITVNPANRNSVFGGGINVLHDIIPLKYYGDRGSGYMKRIKRLIDTSDCLIVPSEHVRDDIKKTLKCDREICVIRLGWQHYPDIPEDEGIFDRYPCLEKGAYYFTMSGISPHKNLRFVYEAAKREADRIFVIAGAMNRGYGYEHEDLKNLIFTGRISDKEAKALMTGCRAFIFPSQCEGAGLPPLEALSCKVPVLASDIEVIHEYCGDSVHYFDPNDYGTDIEEILRTEVSDPGEALGRLSWDRAARELKDIIEN